MTVDKEKLRNKLQFIRIQLKHLEELRKLEKAEFSKDHIVQAAATRMLQIAVEALLDVCSHVISREGWGIPKSYVESVELVTRNGLLPDDTEPTYKAMACLRNRVVHMYDEVSTDELWEILQSQLGDFRFFAGRIVERYFNGGS